MRSGLKVLLCLVYALLLTGEAHAKKDFKGLFGSYRREKFTENEARSSDFGIDVMLSTLIPVTSIVKSTEVRGESGSAMATSTFFNVEGSVFYSLMYHWQLFANFGYYTFDTRKENSTSPPDLPLFHQFEMTAIPIVGGLKYRFGTDDIVPYIGVGVGVAFVTRKGNYDYNDVQKDEEKLNVLAGQLIGGIEFYFAPRAGIRLETSVHYMKLPQRTFDPTISGSAANFPIMIYQPNTWSIRYASGLFFLF